MSIFTKLWSFIRKSKIEENKQFDDDLNRSISALDVELSRFEASLKRDNVSSRRRRTA